MYQFSIALENLQSCTYGISNWELRDGFFGADLAEMTPGQVEDARDLLIRKLSRVVLYTTDLHVAEYAAFVRFFRNAHLLGIVHVCLSSAALAGATDEQIKAIIGIGASFSIGVLFQMEAESMDAFNFDRYAQLRAENTGLVFSPNAFIKAGIRPYTQVLSKTKFAWDIRFLRVEDLQQDPQMPVALLKGNSELKECASKLLTRTFHGYFSFAPYGTGEYMDRIINSFAEVLCAM